MYAKVKEKQQAVINGNIYKDGEVSLIVEHLPSKQMMGVQFSLPTPYES